MNKMVLWLGWVRIWFLEETRLRWWGVSAPLIPSGLAWKHTIISYGYQLRDKYMFDIAGETHKSCKYNGKSSLVGALENYTYMADAK